MTKTLLSIAGIFMIGISTLFAGPANDFKELYKSKDYPEAVKLIPAALAEKSKDAELYEMAGTVYYGMAMRDSAFIMYKNAYDLKPKDGDFMRQYAKILSETGKANEAIELLEKAIKSSPKEVKNYLSLGQAYIKAGEMSKADLEIRKAQKMDEKLPEGWFALADLYYAQKVYPLAIDNYLKGLAIEPMNIDARVNLATSYYVSARSEEDQDLKQNYYNESLNQWEIVANKDPKNANAFWEAGKIYYFSETWDKAAIYLNKYVQLRPDHSLARYYLTESLYKISQCDELIKNADIVAKEIDSVKVKVKSWSAECLYKSAQYTEAIAAYKALSAEKQLSADELERVSLAYIYTGDSLTAIKSYRDVIKVDPKRSSLANFGILAFQLKDYNTAAEYLSIRDKNIQDESSDKMRYYMGLSFMFAGDSLKAASTFETVIAKDSNNFSAYIYLSDAYTKLGQKEKAMTLLQQAIAKMSSDAKTNENMLNNAYQKLCSTSLSDKNYKEMGNLAKNWTSLLPDSQYAVFFYALSFHANGDVDNACKYYRKVVSMDPSTEIAKNAKKYVSDLKCGK